MQIEQKFLNFPPDLDFKWTDIVCVSPTSKCNPKKKVLFEL